MQSCHRGLNAPLPLRIDQNGLVNPREARKHKDRHSVMNLHTVSLHIGVLKMATVQLQVHAQIKTDKHSR